jgi:hypothetical protein
VIEPKVFSFDEFSEQGAQKFFKIFLDYFWGLNAGQDSALRQKAKLRARIATEGLGDIYGLFLV